MSVFLLIAFRNLIVIKNIKNIRIFNFLSINRYFGWIEKKVISAETRLV